jgi:hypothetical protein
MLDPFWSYNLLKRTEKVTRDIAIQACAHRGHLLEDIDDSLKDEELCVIAMSNEYWVAFINSPEELQKQRWFRIYAISQDGRVLRYIPEEERDEELCLLACLKYGWCLKWVPSEMRTLKVCRAAAENHKWAIEDVPRELRSEL